MVEDSPRNDAAPQDAPPDAGASQPGTTAPWDMDRLVAEHLDAVYRYAYRLCGSEADAEDLTQQTFMAAQGALDQLREPAAARGWLLTILRHGYLRRGRRRTPLVASSIELNLDAIPEDRPEELLLDEGRLQEALDELPAEYKLVLLLFYFDDLSYREIAERLQIPIGTVMSRLSRAKSHLRARLLATEHQESGRDG